MVCSKNLKFLCHHEKFCQSKTTWRSQNHQSWYYHSPFGASQWQ